MKFDRNTVIGFALLALLFFFYFYYNSKQYAAIQREQAIKDSIERAMRPQVDTAAASSDAANIQAQWYATRAGIFQQAVAGEEELVVAENSVFKIAFTNKGGQPKYVELKNFKNTANNQPVQLAASDFDQLIYTINTAPNQSMLTNELYFSGVR
jgi:hypothetical protein